MSVGEHKISTKKILRHHNGCRCFGAICRTMPIATITLTCPCSVAIMTHNTWHSKITQRISENVCRYSILMGSFSCNHTDSHYDDVIMSAIASQITSLTSAYSTVYSGANQRKHESSASLAFVRGPVNSPHKGSVTRKMFPFDDVIMLAWRVHTSWTVCIIVWLFG